MKVTPECRYGHGELDWQVDPSGEISQFVLGGVHAENGQFTPTSRFFGVKLFRCSTCGYIELFDDV
jgi:hypothetical protein